MDEEIKCFRLFKSCQIPRQQQKHEQCFQIKYKSKLQLNSKVLKQKKYIQLKPPIKQHYSNLNRINKQNNSCIIKVHSPSVDKILQGNIINKSKQVRLVQRQLNIKNQFIYQNTDKNNFNRFKVIIQQPKYNPPQVINIKNSTQKKLTLKNINGIKPKNYIGEVGKQQYKHIKSDLIQFQKNLQEYTTTYNSNQIYRNILIDDKQKTDNVQTPNTDQFSQFTYFNPEKMINYFHNYQIKQSSVMNEKNSQQVLKSLAKNAKTVQSNQDQESGLFDKSEYSELDFKQDIMTRYKNYQLVANNQPQQTLLNNENYYLQNTPFSKPIEYLKVINNSKYSENQQNLLKDYKQEQFQGKSSNKFLIKK